MSEQYYELNMDAAPPYFSLNGEDDEGKKSKKWSKKRKTAVAAALLLGVLFVAGGVVRSCMNNDHKYIDAPPTTTTPTSTTVPRSTSLPTTSTATTTTTVASTTNEIPSTVYTTTGFRTNYQSITTKTNLHTATEGIRTSTVSYPRHFHCSFFQKIVIGYAREVVSAKRIQDCMTSCVNAIETFGFECKSLMFYNNDKECILNTEDHLDKPEMFINEDEELVIYMDKNSNRNKTNDAEDGALPTAQATSACRNGTTFVRVPQMLLIGFSQFALEDIDSVEQCQDKCANFSPDSENSSDFVCRSMEYYVDDNACVLNSESRATKPNFFMAEKEDEYKVDYYDVIHYSEKDCSETSLSTTTEVLLTTTSLHTPDVLEATTKHNISYCEPGTMIMFIHQHNGTLGNHIRTIPINTIKDCRDHCAQSEDCARAVFYDDNRCGVYDIGTCIETDRVCSVPVHFETIRNKILMGFAREVVPSGNMKECMVACLNATDTFGFKCLSAMYFPYDRECILNTESRISRPDQFVDEDIDKVIYIDNKCDGPLTVVSHEMDIPCHNTANFTRVPQMILVGYAAYVMTDIVNVESCKDMCANLPPDAEPDFICKSVMYYYNQQECILNSESRSSKPDLFVPEADDFKVDYFDVTHHTEKDCSGTALRNLHTTE